MTGSEGGQHRRGVHSHGSGEHSHVHGDDAPGHRDGIQGSRPHDHGHDDHTHGIPAAGHGRSRAPLAWALTMTAIFAVVEAGGGWWSGSLALLSDAGHMLPDAIALGLALFAQTVARRPPSDRNTFG